ncbi:DoxX family protein [Endozoicomonas arenosclerae]|uniref:DoxX family protein n=1 Tax=Endozoicomonas arenosclerae TaxID=1633495 RepID=UPI0007817289|nr:DoxX family protein [Endozoicomonas arenosclerae]
MKIQTAQEYLAIVRMPLQQLLPLGLRLWVANVFFFAGLNKYQSWDTTMMLFEYEYAVPFLAPDIAAWLGTFGELFFPVLLVLGLGGPIAAIALFVVNLIAAISYPDISAAGMQQHYLWGFMLMVLAIYGNGQITLDRIIQKLYIDKLYARLNTGRA